MFLFTSLPASEGAGAGSDSPVTSAIKDAAGRTGVSFDYLIKTAERESRLDPQAKAPTSSASGLFQFLEQTWLGLVRSDGARLGMAGAANAVVAVRDGRLTISDPQLKARVLALRDDPKVASTAAGVFTARNREALTGTLGRPPSEGELYIAHFLGAGGAAQLVKLAEIKPGANAASYFGEAASANRGIFYERSGRPRTAAEVYHALIAAHESARPPRPVEVAAAAPTANVASDAPAGKPLLGLFRSLPEGAANGIQKTWAGLPHTSDFAGASRRSFFPYGDDAVTATARAASGLTPTEPATPVIVSAVASVPEPALPGAEVPLPPIRLLAGQGIHTRPMPAAPLNLLSFTQIKG
jgi:hypothetical protein